MDLLQINTIYEIEDKTRWGNHIKRAYAFVPLLCLIIANAMKQYTLLAALIIAIILAASYLLYSAFTERHTKMIEGVFIKIIRKDLYVEIYMRNTLLNKFKLNDISAISIENKRFLANRLRITLNNGIEYVFKFPNKSKEIVNRLNDISFG